MTMVGLKEQNDNNFTPEKYEEFYEHHYFEPVNERAATKVNEYIPRFGWAFDVIEELGAKSLLDLGTLDGSFPLTVGAQLGIPVVGIDLTQEGIDIAKERAKKFGVTAKFYQGTIEEHLVTLAGRGEKFDVITFFEIIEHVKDVQLCLKLIDKVLAPGGSVLCSTPAYESPLYGKDDEENTCHIRLYTMADDDYESENTQGHVRKATSISKEIGVKRICYMGLHNELINVRYQ